MEIIDVVRKLVGDIDPIGETRTDEKRLENLKAMIELVDGLLTDIDNVQYHNKDRHEGSMKLAAKTASAFFTRLGIPE